MAASRYPVPAGLEAADSRTSRSGIDVLHDWLSLSIAQRAAAVLSMLALAGCATASLEKLPPAPAIPPPIVAAQGALSEKSAERLLENRLGEHDDPHVRELVDAFRAVAAAPLVAGNRALLIRA